MRNLLLGLFLLLVAAPVAAQKVPANATRNRSPKGWECNSGYVQRGDECVSLRVATADEIRQYLIRESLATYPGSCACPYNVDRAGRRCGARSAYSRPGGRAPMCYPQDVSDEQVRETRARHSSSGASGSQNRHASAIT